MKKILLFLAFAFTVLATYAQEKPDANKMVQNRVENMKANLSLSSTESKAFWSAYEQFLRSEIKYHDTFRTNLEKKGIKSCGPKCGDSKTCCENLTDAQITYLYDQRFELRKNLLNLEMTFHKKIKTILTPKHLQEFYKIDEKYKRNLVKSKSAQNKAPQNKTAAPTQNKPRR